MITVIELNEMSKKVYAHTVKKGDMIKTVFGYAEVQEVEVVTTEVEFNGKMYPSTTTTITTNGKIAKETYKLADTVVVVRLADLVAKAEANAVLTDAKVEELERVSVSVAEEMFKKVMAIKLVANKEQLILIDDLTNEETIEQFGYLIEVATPEVVAPVEALDLELVIALNDIIVVLKDKGFKGGFVEVDKNNPNEVKTRYFINDIAVDEFVKCKIYLYNKSTEDEVVIKLTNSNKIICKLYFIPFELERLVTDNVKDILPFLLTMI